VAQPLLAVHPLPLAGNANLAIGVVGALLVNRPTGRFILRTGSAGSKGCAPTCHDLNRVADSPLQS